jgi:hypothetical protein
MRIIAYEGARVTALFPLEEAVPLSGGESREILAKVKARYNFAKATDPATVPREEITKNGYKLETGTISRGDQTAGIAELGIFSDGIVVNGSNTDDCEFLIRDLIDFARAQLGFRSPLTAPVFHYLSQIIVEFDKPLDRLISNFSAISNAITREVDSVAKQPIAFARLDLSWDKKTFPAVAIVPKFIIERRANIPYEKERYFCGAPLKTEAHLRVLEQIESLLL